MARTWAGHHKLRHLRVHVDKEVILHACGEPKIIEARARKRAQMSMISVLFFAGKLIMVIGGSAARNTRDWVDDIEIVSTDPTTTPVPECLRGLNAFPLGTIYYGAGALTTSGTSIQCHKKKSTCEILLSKILLN